TTLNLHRCDQVKDLTPLKNMPLTTLSLFGCPIQDLTPLKGLPLTRLNLVNCHQLRDLTPLEGMNLTELAFTPRNITKGVDAIRRMQSLKGIGPFYESPWSPEEFWKRYDAGEFKYEPTVRLCERLTAPNSSPRRCW